MASSGVKPWSDAAAQEQRAIADSERILSELADEVLLPAVAQNYDASGLRADTGRLRTAISTRYADGNVTEVLPRPNGGSVIVGVSYEDLPYARWQLEGSRAHDIWAKSPGGALRFQIGGRWVFARRVRHPGTRPRRVYYLTDEQRERARAFIAIRLAEQARRAA